MHAQAVSPPRDITRWVSDSVTALADTTATGMQTTL